MVLQWAAHQPQSQPIVFQHQKKTTNYKQIEKQNLYSTQDTQMIYSQSHKTELTNFYHEINTLHPNLEFTLERFVNKKLPFLYTELNQVSNQLHTNKYRKATDTGLIMQYFSICPKSCKLGLINFYLNRALYICSNFSAFKEELTKIKNLFLKNQYPKNLIESKINKLL